MQINVNPFKLWQTASKWHSGHCDIGALSNVMGMDVNDLHNLLREYQVAEADGRCKWPKNTGLTLYVLLFILITNNKS